MSYPNLLLLHVWLNILKKYVTLINLFTTEFLGTLGCGFHLILHPPFSIGRPLDNAHLPYF